MYASRKSNDNALMTNLNSISSSLSSIDTIGRRTSTKASADNLITLRSQSIASTSLLWPKNSKNNDRYATASSIRNGTFNRSQLGSEIYYSGGGTIKSYCMSSETASNLMLIPFLLLTIVRQVFDFMGQIWLQILINFFTIILIIVALFGIRQHRISYIGLYSFWALFNALWNLFVICIYTKIRDVGVTEDFLSLNTGATSWWYSNGPGCLPYNITSIQPSINILQQNIITGCRIDYHTIESSQAALHALISLISSFICCFLIVNTRRNFVYKKNQKADKLYRLNNLIADRSKVNQNPFPAHGDQRGIINTASLRRAQNKTSSRSSQHSVSSMRSARRRRQSGDSVMPTPRGSTSSAAQRSQKYGSLSSRRSTKKERRNDVSSLTYGTAGATNRAGPSGNRTRLSSMSSNDYLPSYQPPHSSNTNLLSSYGEISSIDSYNNNVGYRSNKNRQTSSKSVIRGNTNPTYTGSRSSIYSHGNSNANNYDDLSYIYGNNNAQISENHYGASTSNGDNRRQKQLTKTNTSVRGQNGYVNRNPSLEIHAETYQQERHSQSNGDTMTKAKLPLTNGSFQSFSATNHQQKSAGTRAQMNGEDNNKFEVNNNYMPSNYEEDCERRDTNGYGSSSFNNRSKALENPTNAYVITDQSQVHMNHRNQRFPIYSNHVPNGNSETPI